MVSAGSISFARDIQPLFRESDRDAMHFVFDLWDYSDVCTNAEDILERLADGTMPCDEEWPDEQIVLSTRPVKPLPLGIGIEGAFLLGKGARDAYNCATLSHNCTSGRSKPDRLLQTDE